MPLSHTVQICSKVSCFQNKSSSYQDLKCSHPHPTPLRLYGHCILFNLGKIWIESCHTLPWGRCVSQMKCCRQKGSTHRLGSCESSQTFICISPLLLSGDWKQSSVFVLKLAVPQWASGIPSAFRTGCFWRHLLELFFSFLFSSLEEL